MLEIFIILLVTFFIFYIFDPCIDVLEEVIVFRYTWKGKRIEKILWS